MPETIHDALRESHERQRSLCRKLLRAPPHSARRIGLFTDLRIKLAAHAAAEERFLHAPILMHDAGLDVSRHALHDHHRMDELAGELQITDHNGRGWMATAKKRPEKVHNHLRAEEREFFQVSGRLLNDTQKTQLGRRYRKDVARMEKKLRID